MADKKNQALKRLLKKLSALRATLRHDERVLLDEIILGSVAEVSAHTMTAAASKGAKTPKPAEVSAHAMTTAASKGAKTPKPAEVSAHAMTTAASKGAKTPKPAEVSAHAMTTNVIPNSINAMIEFDAQAKVYKVKTS